MKKIILALLLIVVSVAAFAQKKRTKINRHLTVDAEEVLIPNFTVNDHNGHSLKFEKPRVWKFKNGTAVKWGNKTRGHRGRHKLIDETIDSTAEPVVIPPVEQEPQPIPIPMPEEAVVERQALSVGGGNPKALYVIDYDKYVQLGSNTQNCISWLMEGIAESQAAIDEIPALGGMKFDLKEIIVNTVPSFYSKMPANASGVQIFNEFGVDYCHRWDVDLKVLVTARNIGGIATMGLGSRVWNLAVLGCVSRYWVPSNTFNNIYVWRHEVFGHPLNARHSFECFPQPNGTSIRIDSTYSSTGAGCSRTTKRPTVPTSVMSYGQLYQMLDTNHRFHPFNVNEMVSFWNGYKANIPLGTAPTCQFTTGPWSEWSGGYRSRSVTATPSNCRGIAPVCLERQPPVVNPPPTPTNTFSISGTPYPGYTRADTSKAIDGNESTRFLTNGATTLTWNFAVPTTRTSVYLSSGYQGGSPNQTLTLTVDGVDVPLAFDKKVKFTKAINATGKRFVLTTTGYQNVSRIFEISLK